MRAFLSAERRSTPAQPIVNAADAKSSTAVETETSVVAVRSTREPGIGSETERRPSASTDHQILILGPDVSCEELAGRWGHEHEHVHVLGAGEFRPHAALGGCSLR